MISGGRVMSHSLNRPPLVRHMDTNRRFSRPMRRLRSVADRWAARSHDPSGSPPQPWVGLSHGFGEHVIADFVAQSRVGKKVALTH